MKDFTPKKVFIMVNGKYEELSYREYKRRKATDPIYADKLFVVVQGYLMETDQEHYTEFYRAKERQKYLEWLDETHGLFSYDAYDTESDRGSDFYCVSCEDVAEKAVKNVLLEKLRSVMYMLPEEDFELINLHYFMAIPQTELAKVYGIKQSSVSRRISKVLSKLKNLMEN